MSVARVKCGFPPCDEPASHHIVARCVCHAIAWDAKVCPRHLIECERTARRMLEPHHLVTVKELRPS